MPGSTHADATVLGSTTSPDQMHKTIPLGVYILASSLFAMGSAEFLMGGILPQISSDLHIPLPRAGTLISAFAIGALIGAPPLALLTLRWSRRTTLFASQIAFVLATVTGMLINGFEVLIATRVIMGLSYACFWAAAASTAVQLAPEDHKAKSLSIVVSGLTVAMIVGGPAGTYISEIAGWRAGFWTVAFATVLSSFAVLATIPDGHASSGARPDARSELRAMGRPALWMAYATTALTTAAYMGTFGYLGAMLIEVAQIPPAWLPPMFALFGVGAFIGLTVGGRTADAHPLATLTAGVIMIALVSIGITYFASSIVIMVGLIFLLGVAGFVLNPAVWGRVYVIAPDAPTLVGATNSSAFQLGLTLAPLLSGFAIAEGFGLPSIGWVGAALAVAGLATALVDRSLARPNV